MRKFFLPVLFAIAACFHAVSSCATHLFGGELLYAHVANKQYKVTLTMYGDCSGENFNRLYDATPAITLYNGTSTVKIFKLEPESIGIEVSPVCPDEVENTNCKGGTLPGVKRFIYSKIIDIPYPSADWSIVFAGEMGNGSFAGRSNSITNVAVSTPMMLVARLNNTDGDNNSPVYNTIPTPFYCINTQQQYNQGAGDPDNDSLAFSLVPALDENGFQVAYVAPYTSLQPLATANFSFNSFNGQMAFRPNLLQKSVVVNLVAEYRNGVLVGTSMREMTIIVLDNCNNNPPGTKELSKQDVSGGLYIGDNVINICEGITTVTFDLPITDADGDNIEVALLNLPAGAGGNITGNNTKTPVLHFNWDITSVAPGTYNIYLSMKDDNCPLSSNQTIAYTIQILKPAEVGYSVLSPTRCLYEEQGQITISKGALPRLVTISSNGATVKTYHDTIGIIKDRFKPGIYDVSISSPNLLCSSQFRFAVVDSGAYPYKPTVPDHFYCPGDTTRPIEVIPGKLGKIIWYDSDGNLIDKIPTISTAAPGVTRWYISEIYRDCESEKEVFEVTVYEPPVAAILNEPARLCKGDKVLLQGAGYDKYEWYPQDKVNGDRDGNYFARVMEPATYYGVAVSEHGCRDTASVTYSDIENCCRFSYPSAFTPNRDGKNDNFKPVIYGNQEDYEIRIFNRWGQMVFQSDNPSGSWNGAFGGKACDMGTYFYLVRSRCVTGHIEHYKGEVLLIR